MSESRLDTTNTTLESGAKATTTPICQVGDCRLPIDVVFISRDGIRLGMHKKNLEDFSDGFPPPECDSTEDVQLEEKEEVLRLLFQLMHKQTQPDLRTMSYEILADLAEAAHKYIVHHASMACNLALERYIAGQPFKVLRLAKRYEWAELEKVAFEEARRSKPVDIFAYAVSIDDAGLCTEFLQKSLRADAEDLIAALENHECPSILATSAFTAWTRLRRHVQSRLLAALHNPPTIQHKGGYTDCSLWQQFFYVVKAHVESHPSYEDFADIVDREKGQINCVYCEKKISPWHNRMALVEHVDLATYNSFKYKGK